MDLRCTGVCRTIHFIVRRCERKAIKKSHLWVQDFVYSNVFWWCICTFFFNLICVCRRFRLKMTPSLDIYCFGMVALFIFTEKNWWANLARPLPKVPTADDISSRQKQVKAMIVSMERSDSFFQTIGQQIREMLNHNPKNRPHARDCVFEFCDPGTTNDEYDNHSNM